MWKKEIDFSKKKDYAKQSSGPPPEAAPVVYIKDLYRDKPFYTVDDVMEILSVSRSTAYRIIANLQRKLPGAKYALSPGEIPKDYFDKQLYAYSRKGQADDKGN